MQSDASWKELNLGDVIELKRGYDLPKGKRSVGVIPIVSSSGISDFHSEAMVKGPGVVTGRYGTIGEVFYIAGDFWPLNTTLYVRDFKGNDPCFISYFLRTLDFQAYSDKGAVPGVNRNHLHTARVRIPAPPVQKAIAKVLATLDSKIDLNRRLNQTLEAMAQAIFKSWFVDFDPVKAKITAIAQGQDPLRAAMHAISGKTDAELDQMSREHYEQLAATATLFPDEMEESELGEIPKGWAIRTLGGVTNYLSRGISPKYLENGGVLVLNQKCIRDFRVDELKGRRHDPTQKAIDSRLLKLGDVLVNSTGVGTLGRVAQIRCLNEPTIVDSHITVVRASHKLNASYLGQYIVWKQPNIEAMGEGSTGQTELSRAKLAELPVLTPCQNVLKVFDNLISSLNTAISANACESRKLTELRDTLLPKLISGELPISAMGKLADITGAA